MRYNRPRTLLRKAMDWKTWLFLLFLSLPVWGLKVAPQILVGGAEASLRSFDSSDQWLLNLFGLLLGSAWMLICLTRLLAEAFVFPISHSQIRQLYRDQTSEHLPLQMLSVLLCSSSEPSEKLIWILSGLFYMFLSLGASLVSIRQSNLNYQIRIRSLTLILLFLATTFPVVVIQFYYKGLICFLVMNLTGLICVKTILFALFQIHLDGKKQLEYSLEIAVNGAKLVQWLYIGVSFCGSVLAYPTHFFMFWKNQELLVAFYHSVRRLLMHNRTISAFMRQYPALDSNQTPKDGICPICFQSFYQTSCCLIPCKHILHIECLRQFMLISHDPRCPLCNEPCSLRQEELQMNSFLDLLNPNISQFEDQVRMVHAMFPYMIEDDIRNDLQRSGDVNATIDNLLVNNQWF